eukprot:TRINITY_DN3983_c0_g1_i10.p1 TRINITY_DN3983_c0_g1~~TRINITY_DN3983_c0_g1_i10.p1  ORF type:complete len:1036 (-),score=179.93 TRINITY_DN3983_c0_g1_i10:156-3263(-)
MGPICTCKSEEMCTIYSECSASLGQCVCKLRRTGSDCSACDVGYYGAECTSTCDCNSRGPCDQSSGLCECYADDTNGYWSGGSCTICLDGYMGTACKQRSNTVSKLSTLRVSSTSDVGQVYIHLQDNNVARENRNALGVPDAVPAGQIYPDQHRLYVGGRPLNAEFDVSTVLSQVLYAGSVYKDKLNAVVCGDISGMATMPPQYDDGALGPNATAYGDQVFLLAPNSSCTGRMSIYRNQYRSRHAYDAYLAAGGTPDDAVAATRKFDMMAIVNTPQIDQNTRTPLSLRQLHQRGFFTAATTVNASEVYPSTFKNAYLNNNWELLSNNAFGIQDTISRTVLYSHYFPSEKRFCSLLFDGAQAYEFMCGAGMTSSSLYQYPTSPANASAPPPTTTQMQFGTLYAPVAIKDWQGTTYVPDIDRFVVVGTDQFSVCTILFFTSSIQIDNSLYSVPVGAPLNNAVGENTTACRVIDCVTSIGNYVIFVAVYTDTYIVAYDVVNKVFLTPASAGAGSRCNAISYDPTSTIGMAVFLNRVMKFELVNSQIYAEDNARGPSNPRLVLPTTTDYPYTTLVAYGQTYIVDSSIASLTVHSSLAVVYAPLSIAKGIQVERFMLVEVRDLSQKYAERLGGAIISISGRNFRNVPELRCKFGDQSGIPAVYYNPHLITCVVPRLLTTEACVSEAVEVTISNLVYTQNLIMLERPDGPLLDSVSPSFVRVGNPEPVEITGRNLVLTPQAECRFVDEDWVNAQSTPRAELLAQLKLDPSITEFVHYVAAIYNETSGKYSCMSPNATLPWSPSSVIEVTLDGQVYSGSQLKFLVVGKASSIAIFPSKFTAVSSSSEAISPELQVYVTDVRGNQLQSIDAGNYRPIELLIPVPAINVTAITNLGVAVFSALRLLSPTSGTWTITAVAANGDWQSTATLTVEPGSLQSIYIRTPPFKEGDLVIPGKVIPRQTEIDGLDSAGNIVSFVTTGLDSQNLHVWMAVLTVKWVKIDANGTTTTTTTAPTTTTTIAASSSSSSMATSAATSTPLSLIHI